MVKSEAHIRTDSAERYAKQLTSHAVHMGARSKWTPPNGLVEFPHGGTCRLTATPDELVLAVDAASPDQLATIQRILSADFRRFGQRHGMSVTWSS